MGLGEFHGGEGLGLQAVAGLGDGEMGQFGHGAFVLFIGADMAYYSSGDPRVARRLPGDGRIRRPPYSTTFGTRKKPSSVAGAFRTILSA
jgi:hypothetical protein